MKELVCITCPKGCHLLVDDENGFSVTGNDCPRGAEYAYKEVTNPTRTLTSTVRISGAAIPRLPVKSNMEIPRNLLLDAAILLDDVDISAPVKLGQVILANVLGTGADIVSTRSLDKI